MNITNININDYIKQIDKIPSFLFKVKFWNTASVLTVFLT